MSAQPETHTGPFGEAARAILASGIGSPLPLPYGKKAAPPAGWTGRGAQRPSAADVEAWVETSSDGNMAVRLADDVIGIDVDDYDGKGGMDTLCDFARQRGVLPPTWRTSSRDDGRSGVYLYRLPPGDPSESALGDMGPGVEIIRASHRYATMPPSRHPSGHDYRWFRPDGTESPTPPSRDELPELAPAQVRALVRLTPVPAPAPTPVATEGAARNEAGIRRYLEAADAADAAMLADVAQWPEGRRDDRGRGWEKIVADLCLRRAGLAKGGWTGRDEWAALRDIVPASMAAAVDLAAKWAAQAPRADAAPMPASLAAGFDAFDGWETGVLTPSRIETAGEVVATVEGAMTDANVADAFVNRVRGRVRYCHGLGWLQFDGRRFAEVDESVILHESKMFAQALTVQAATSNDPERLKAAMPRMKASAIRAVVALAKGNPDLRVDVTQLDADPWLLNCSNGTLDLRTRSLRPHRPDDLLTKVTAGAYDPTAGTHAWIGFLESVIPDGEERAYLQRVFGQAAYGRVREHLFAVFTGEGANGKGTCYGAVTGAFGDYAAIINPDMLMLRDRGGVGGPEMMQLRGARIVIGSETERDRQLDEAMMKRLTGGDELTARNLYCPPVSWQPSHQLVYVTNHLPRVKGNDPAVWRRIRVVPFDVVVPPERRDPGLPERLAGHVDAVLTWAVQGWFDYVDRGDMAEPDTVRLATDAYAVRSDAVRRFIDEMCETAPLLHESGRELYGAWQRWSVADGAEPMTEKAFAGELERLGHESRKTSRANVRVGLRLLSEGSPP